MKYIALLRGINVGGHNIVSMPDLKLCFEGLDFKDVKTYINSGNVIFRTYQPDIAILVQLCETAIASSFGFPVTCAVISADELKQAIDNAPAWWGSDPNSKHNAIFVIPPAKAEEIIQQEATTKPQDEQIAAYKSVIFWTAPLATFSHTRYSKIVSSKTRQSITIRNANTTKKLAQLC
jgi:uncharacterized protein (DUF1697 family)